MRFFRKSECPLYGLCAEPYVMVIDEQTKNGIKMEDGPRPSSYVIVKNAMTLSEVYICSEVALCVLNSLLHIPPIFLL